MLLKETLIKFEAHQFQEIEDYFNQHGYVIVKQLLDEELIDQFLDSYNAFKWRFYPLETQDTHQIEPLKKDENDFLVHSIMNPKDLVFANKFSSNSERCLTAEGVGKVLSLLSGKEQHNIYQSMFFDKSTGTVAHQDHYYLDTEPAGHMIAAWFAIEDIHPDSGCFFVMPDTHTGEIVKGRDDIQRFDDHEDYVEQIQALIEEKNYQIRPCPLSKGDVLFWHPYTIHGAFKNQDPRFSRKSLTAHYIPRGYDVKNQYARKIPDTVASSINPNFYIWKRNRLKAQLGFFKRCLIYLVRQLYLRKPKLEMRSVKYE